MKTNVHKTLLLEKPVYGGDCLAHVDGKAVFVPLTLPGERVLARLTEEKRQFAKAEILSDSVLEPSAHRVAPRCPYFGACGGCQYQHADYGTQLEWKLQILRETLSRAKVPIPDRIAQLSGEPWFYRNRIRLAVTNDADRALLNYRSRASHDLIAIEQCPIAAPVLLSTAKAVARFLEEQPSPMAISELELFTNQDEGELLLTLFCESDGATEFRKPQEWLAQLQAALPASTTGIRLELDNGALVPEVLAGTGSSSLSYTAAGLAYQVDHGAFFQVNRCLVDEFVDLAVGGKSGGSAWDLYAGVGLFARQLIRNFAQVTAVESARTAFPALQRNLAGTAATAISATTLDFLRRNREEREPRPDLIVMDPPRAGLGEQTTQMLNAIGAPEMVYVSCDPTTLARDLQAFTRERYRIESVTLVDMFPQTYHLETIVHLRRS